jgi:hypothetical protein
MDRYFPDGDKTSGFTGFGYLVAQTDDFAGMPKSAALGQMETSANFGAELSYPHANRSPTLSGTNAVIRRFRAMDEAAWVNGRWHHDVIMGLVDREFR